MSTELLVALRQAVAPGQVLTADSTDLLAYEQDWRGRQRGHALAVVRPGNTREVAAVMALCHASRTPVVPQGGNTGLVLGGVPDGSGREIVLNLTRLNAIRNLDPDNLTMTLEAGVVLQHAQQHARDAGLLLPLSLAAEGSCTIGGNLSTNAGGTQALRHGTARELALGLEVVTPDGRVLSQLKGLRKDNTGYDLKQIYLGSEGTLGVITAACLKLQPLPLATQTAWAAVPDLGSALQLLALARQRLGAGLSSFELMGQLALGLVDRHYPQLRVPLWRDSPWCVLVEHDDHESDTHARMAVESLLATGMEEGWVTDAVLAESVAQGRQLWEMRERISLAQAAEGLNVKHDISVAVSAIPAFVVEADAVLQQAWPGVRNVTFGHLGDGNLHYNVQAPLGVDAGGFLREHEAAINACVYGCVQRHRGSISAEHGIGALKAASLPDYQDPIALALMRDIKRALDPYNIMNPGRVLTRDALIA